jgi:hypothetical protein
MLHVPTQKDADSAQAAILSRLTGALDSARNSDGGWGYYGGKASRLEPTCWAILTLLQAGRPSNDWDPRAAFRLFEHWQDSRGLLADLIGAPPNLAFNGLAALAVYYGERCDASQQARLAEIRERVLRGIRSVAGVRFPKTPTSRPYDTLRGWPWIEETFSWVEPTSMCLLALKKAESTAAKSESAARVDEAERMLFDRCCRGGGWNFGTSEVFGKLLRAYVPSTALALLALQDHKDHQVVARGVEFLARNETSETSGMALGLAAIALRAYDRPVDHVEAGLAQVASTTLSVGNLVNVAIAAFALAARERGVEPFVLQSHTP